MTHVHFNRSKLARCWDAFETRCRELRTEAGCLQVELLQPSEAGDEAVIISLWADAESHAAHHASESYDAFARLCADEDLLSGDPDIRLMQARRDALVAQRQVAYAVPGSGDCQAIYYRPNGGGTLPGVLLCPGRNRDVNGIAFIATALAAAGFAVLATRYSNDGMLTDDADTQAGLSWLCSQPDVLADRVHAVGHSRGGMAVLRLCALDSRVRSAVAIQPPIDMVRYMAGMAAYVPMRYAALKAQMGGTPEEVPDNYRQMSAISYAERIAQPVLLIWGGMDLYSPMEHGEPLKARWKTSGKTNFEERVFPTLGHFFESTYYPHHKAQLADAVRDWLLTPR